jgi:DNA-binding transcriptional ArsR family regulator
MIETKSDDDEESTREEYPTGWLVLTKNESAAKIVDALLDLPPTREFNQTELAEQADVSRQSVKNHLDLLLGLDVLEEVEGTRPQRYRFNAESDVSEAIIRLDGAVNAAGPGADT